MHDQVLELAFGIKMSAKPDDEDTAAHASKPEAHKPAPEQPKAAPQPEPEPEPMDDDAREAAARKKQALEEKEKGNAAYKKKVWARCCTICNS